MGIDFNSGGGGSPVRGTLIPRNVIRDGHVDIAVNTPAEFDIHLRDLLGGKIGVANICAFDNPSHLPACTGTIDATGNFGGCTPCTSEGPPAEVSLNFRLWQFAALVMGFLISSGTFRAKIQKQDSDT